MKTIDLTANDSSDDGGIKVIFSANGDHVWHRGGGEYMLIVDEEGDEVSVKVRDLSRFIDAIQVVIDHGGEML